MHHFPREIIIESIYFILYQNKASQNILYRKLFVSETPLDTGFEINCEEFSCGHVSPWYSLSSVLTCQHLCLMLRSSYILVSTREDVTGAIMMLENLKSFWTRNPSYSDLSL